MKVLDAVINQVDAQNNTASITFVLTSNDNSGTIGVSYVGFSLFMKLAALMGIPDLSIPYGLYTYTTTVTLTA